MLHATFLKCAVHQCVSKLLEHLETSILATFQRSQNLTFQLLQARVTHLLQLFTFAFWLSNQTTYEINRTCTFWSKVSKMSKATTCLRALWETVGTKVWFRWSLPGPEGNGVNCRQNGVNYHQNGVNRNKEFFSHSNELCQGFMSKTITVCIMSWVRTEQVVQKSVPKNNFCERLECCMLKAGSLWTPIDAAITLPTL